jgi:SAM-dependent methyltransferase
MIRFLAKVAGQKMIGSLPGGAHLYGGLQEHLTRSTAPSMARVRQKVEVALTYVRHAEVRAGDGFLARGAHVDVGAGWHLTIPLLFWQLGCERQYLVDVRDHVRAPILRQVVHLLNECDVPDRRRRPLPEPVGFSLYEYLTQLGITYLAPVPGCYPLADGSVTLLTSTQTLLHPPGGAVRRIFEEAARVLAPGGRFAATVHLYDLYADFDPRLNRFNFLRYATPTWERAFNGPLVAYNRLRAPDYATLFEGLPFAPEVWDVRRPTPGDLAELERIPVSPEFARYNVEDLASTHLFFIMRRE